MSRIALSSSRLVDFAENRWRLIALDPDATPSLLAEARIGGGLRFAEAFAEANALPATGELPAGDIRQLSLSWSPETAAWILTLAWSPELSFSEESRAFELLRLVDADHPSREDDARQVGSALATLLDIPFVDHAPAIAPPPEPAPLLDLPLRLGLWQLEAQQGAFEKRGDSSLRLVRDASWRNAKRRQIAWYALLTVIYAWVSLVTLSSDLGLPNAGTLIPNPGLLPYLGIAVAGLLLLMIARGVFQLRREPDSLVMTGDSISAYCGDALRWSMDAAKMQSVYATELVKKRDRNNTIYHAELNLQLTDGAFRRLLADPAKRKTPLLPGVDGDKEKQRPRGVVLLEAEEVSTELQAAALHIARCLGELPTWYDRRFK